MSNNELNNLKTGPVIMAIIKERAIKILDFVIIFAEKNCLLSKHQFKVLAEIHKRNLHRYTLEELESIFDFMASWVSIAIFESGISPEEIQFPDEFVEREITNLYLKIVEKEKRRLKTSSKLPKKVLIPKLIQDVTNKVFKNQISKKNYKGIKEVYELKLIGEENTIPIGPVAVWEMNNVEYIVSCSYLDKFKGRSPKAYVSQDKNIKALLVLVEQQQRDSQNKKAEAIFTFEMYARLRGYTDEEIKRGGKFIEELKKDLIDGAYITFKIDEIVIDGEKYIAHGIPNLYTLLEPKNSRNYWKVRFNTFYEESILKILNSRGQYFSYLLKEVADRETTNKPYLHLFYNQLVFRRQKGKATVPKKVLNLLKEMGASEKILKRPKECWDTLSECISYFGEKYPEELGGICFYNNFEKEKSLPFRNLRTLKNYSYEEIRDWFGKVLGNSDVRELFIVFERPQEEAKQRIHQETPEEVEALVSRIVKWLDDNIEWSEMKKLTRDGSIRFLRYCIKYLGIKDVTNFFESEANAYKPNAVKFLTKTLPEVLRIDKDRKAEIKRLKEKLQIEPGVGKYYPY